MMKTNTITLFLAPVVFFMTTFPAQAQLLKKLGDRLEEKINNRADQKADAVMDKGLDETEKGIEQAVQKKDKPDRLISSGQRKADCGKYYYLTNNSEVEMTMYDRKDNPAMTLTYYISDVKNIPAGIQSSVRTEMKDKKGEVLGGGEGIFKCTNGSLSADMHVSMSSMPMKQFEGMDVKATEAYLIYPADMAVGQSLPDGAFHMDIFRKGKRFSTVDYTVEDRKVEGKEKITTPAGSWQCYRISYHVSMKIKMGVSIPMHYKITEWFAPGFGVVKTKNYNKKGKQMGYSLLTKVKD